MSNTPISTARFARLYKTNPKQLQYHYKNTLSGFNDWCQKAHAKDWVLYDKNLGDNMSIDETSLSNGELYTILTNKKAKGGKGAIVAIIKGTQSETVISILNKISESKRNLVKEITLDMAGSMNLIAKRCFPKATIVTDRFHVQKLASEAVQEERIKLRWEAIEQENKAIDKAKKDNCKYTPEILSNGDTRKQMLARSRYLLFKSKSKWTDSQAERAEILFDLYPTIEKAYNISLGLSSIFENNTVKDVARVKLAKWYSKVEQAGFKSFNVISRTIYHHYETILNYFNNRSTNASAESFNAKIKEFRAQFRLCEIYA